MGGVFKDTPLFLNSNHILSKMKKSNLTPKDRYYRLRNELAPLSYTIATRNNRRYPLLWYDEEKNVNRPLRYAVNQKSPFEDEQDGNAIIEPITFERGFLFVPKTNPVLQQFLYYHPQNGVLFEEVDNERDAQKVVEELNSEVEALIRAREMNIEQLEIVGRVLFQRDTTKVTSAELKRDVLIYARNYPKQFLEALEDPMLKLQSNVHIFFDKSLLGFRNGNKEVWYNTPTNKKKMLTVPYGEDPYVLVSLFLKSDEGIEALKMLEFHLDSA
jgi:hypothetical protein